MQNICIVPVLYAFTTYGLKISDMQPLDDFFDSAVDWPTRMEHDEIASSPMKDSGDVHAYRELFQKWSGKRILLAGDSLLFNTWATIADAAAELGINRSHTLESIFWQNSAEPSMVNEEFKWTDASEYPGAQGLLYSLQVGPTQSSPDSAQISPATIKFYRFYNIQGEPLFNSTWDALFSGAATYDAIFSNLGHHFVTGGTETNRKIIMSACNEARSRGAKHFTLVEHPPSHFRTQNGYYGPGVGCSCDIGVADLRTQPSFTWKRIMEDVATEMNVSATNFWDEFADKCDKHPGWNAGHDFFDCLHYVRDFDTEAPIVRALMQTHSEGQ